MLAAYFLQHRIRGVNDDHQFLLLCGIWETGGHNLHMLCLLVITFSPRLMTGIGSLGGGDSSRQPSQVGEHENGISKHWKSSMCFYFQRTIKHWGQKGLDFKQPVSSSIPLKLQVYVTCCGDTACNTCTNFLLNWPACPHGCLHFPQWFFNSFSHYVRASTCFRTPWGWIKPFYNWKEKHRLSGISYITTDVVKVKNKILINIYLTEICTIICTGIL